MKKTKDHQILLFLVVTSITVIIWVSLGVARSYYFSTIPEVLEDQIRALNPKIKQNVLKSLENQLTISDEDLEKYLEESSEKIIIKKESEASPGANKKASESAKLKIGVN